MRKPIAAVRPATPSVWDTVFAGGCTAVFLVLTASLAGAVTYYLG